MESELDEVEEGKAAWVEVVRDFYDPSRELTRAEEEAERVNIEPQLTDEPCPVRPADGDPREPIWQVSRLPGYPECKNADPQAGRVPCQSRSARARLSRSVRGAAVSSMGALPIRSAISLSGSAPSMCAARSATRL